MCEFYEEADHQAEQQAMAEGEYNEHAQFEEYIEELAKNGEYYLLSLEMAIHSLSSSEFKRSGKTPLEYFVEERDKINSNIKEQPKDTCTHCYGTGLDHGDESGDTPCPSCDGCGHMLPF